MRFSPELDAYNYFWRAIERHGVTVYDHLPAKNEPVRYPFAVMGEAINFGGQTKSSLNGHITLAIDVWGLNTDRGAVAEISHGIFMLAVGEIKTRNYRLRGAQVDQQLTLTIDDSVSEMLFCRGSLQLDLKIL